MLQSLRRPAEPLRSFEPHRTISQDLSKEDQLLRSRLCAFRHSKLASALDGIPSQRPPERAPPPKEELAQEVSQNGKRRRVAIEDSDSDEQGRKKLRKREEKTAVFACPFYKFDPLKHYKCLLHGQAAVRHVKTHLLRAHRAPRHCPICYISFDKWSDLDVHLRKRSCQPSADPSPFVGLITDEQEQLLQVPPLGGGETSRWFGIWDILFPGHAQPESPLLSTTGTSHTLSSSDLRPSLPTTQSIRDKARERVKKPPKATRHKVIEVPSKAPNLSHIPGMRKALSPDQKALRVVMISREEGHMGHWSEDRRGGLGKL